MGEAGVGNLASTQVEQAKLLGASQVGQASVADLGVEERQVHERGHFADACHTIVGNRSAPLQVELINLLERDKFGQAGVSDSGFDQLQVFELSEGCELVEP